MTTFLKVYVRGGLFEKSRQLLLELETLDYARDEMPYCLLMDGLAKAGHVNEAKSIFNEMVTKDVKSGGKIGNVIRVFHVGPSHESTLTWEIHMKIALDAARMLTRGLEYLHENCNPPVIHRDLKSSNILLDSNFNAKVKEPNFNYFVSLSNYGLLELAHLDFKATPNFLLHSICYRLAFYSIPPIQ
ncbi:hypothetical protein IFM89_034896, partial [Coptis chinensis]